VTNHHLNHLALLNPCRKFKSILLELTYLTESWWWG